MPKIKKEFDQTKYQNEYKKKTYDRMELLVPKGEKAVIKEKSAAAFLDTPTKRLPAIVLPLLENPGHRERH